MIDSLLDAKGAWVKFQQGFNYNINGALLNDSLINVKKGWNIIGGLSGNISRANISSVPDSIIASSFFGFTTSGYQVADTLFSGSGYWIKASMDGQIKIKSNNSIIYKKSEIVKLGTFRMNDKDNRQREVFLVKANDVNSFVSPPKPPAEVIDVRFSTECYASNILNTDYTLEISGADFPIKLELINNSSDYKVVGTSSGKSYGILKQGQNININNKEDKLLIQRIEIPDDYYLFQNYPNPFNPKTTIEFGIPKNGNVNLVIYNVLGQEVERLVNNQLFDAGKYKINWNAAKYSSGVYIIRLTSDKFHDVKKMILLK